MNRLFDHRCSFDSAFAILVAVSLFVGPPDDSARQKIIALVAQVQRADYQGDRPALTRLHGELGAFINQADAKLASRVLYWRGFALWRRAFNGFNESAGRKEQEADLSQAAADFRAARQRDPGFIDAKAAEASCVVGLAVLNRDKPEGREMLLESWKLTDEALAAAPENPRLLWIHGANLWYAPPARGGGQAPALATYARGLDFARAQRGKVTDPLEPTWGEPELLTNLAWANLNRTTPDPAAAEGYARQALALVPHWHYVRDILLVQIKAAMTAAAAKASR